MFARRKREVFAMIWERSVCDDPPFSSAEFLPILEAPLPLAACDDEFKQNSLQHLSNFKIYQQQIWLKLEEEKKCLQ